MASTTPLKGSELIDCARANGEKGIDIAAARCGYENDLSTFEEQLRQACKAIGVEINGFNDLITPNKREDEKSGVIIAPDTPTQL